MPRKGRSNLREPCAGVRGVRAKRGLGEKGCGLPANFGYFRKNNRGPKKNAGRDNDLIPRGGRGAH